MQERHLHPLSLLWISICVETTLNCAGTDSKLLVPPGRFDCYSSWMTWISSYCYIMDEGTKGNNNVVNEASKSFTSRITLARLPCRWGQERLESNSTVAQQVQYSHLSWLSRHGKSMDWTGVGRLCLGFWFETRSRLESNSGATCNKYSHSSWLSSHGRMVSTHGTRNTWRSRSTRKSKCWNNKPIIRSPFCSYYYLIPSCRFRSVSYPCLV